jgi:hypothetical protein
MQPRPHLLLAQVVQALGQELQVYHVAGEGGAVAQLAVEDLATDEPVARRAGGGEHQPRTAFSTASYSGS